MVQTVKHLIEGAAKFDSDPENYTPALPSHHKPNIKFWPLLFKNCISKHKQLRQRQGILYYDGNNIRPEDDAVTLFKDTYKAHVDLQKLSNALLGNNENGIINHEDRFKIMTTILFCSVLPKDTLHVFLDAANGNKKFSKVPYCFV